MTEILTQLKDNDKIAFNSLYDKYAPLLYGRIRHLTNNISIACDLLKKSFIDIWLDIGSYNPVKTSLFTWMLQITLKNCQAVLDGHETIV